MFGKKRVQVGEGRGIHVHGAEEQEQDARAQGKGEDDLQDAGNADAPVIHDPEEERSRAHQQDLACVHLPSGYGVEFTEFKDAGKQEAHQKPQRGYVDPDDDHIAKHQSPAADKSTGWSEPYIGIGVFTPGDRGIFNHIAIDNRHKTQEKRTRSKGDERCQGARLRQERVTRQNETSPSDNGTQSQSPYLSWSKAFFQSLTICSIRHTFLLAC